MTWLVTADLHLDDKPMHAYRWGIFDWLAKQQEEYNAQGCLILGDITDQKDCHSASLVNRMVAGLEKLEPPVYILKGNHDFIDQNNPFFGFLSSIAGLEFISQPKEIIGRIAAIPHQANQRDFDAACKTALAGGKKNLVLLHGLFDGAISETGARLSGLSTSLIEQNYKGLVLAGDVHAPQQAGIVAYIGAPYRIKFGDNYTPRVGLVNDHMDISNLHFPCPQKHSLTIGGNDIMNPLYLGDKLKPGDQVKVTIELPREEAVQWAEIKQRTLDICKELRLEVFGIKLKLPNRGDENGHVGKPENNHSATPLQVFDAFCLNEDIQTEIKQAGKELLK